MKTCKICGHDIPDSATKCTVCGSFQNWRGHINVSSTVLALLVALVSVVASAIPVLSEMFDQDDSDVNLVFQSYEIDKDKKYNYFFIAANSGSRPAGLGKATYRIKLETKNLTTESINHLKNNNTVYSPEEDDILLIGIANMTMLSNKALSPAPFLQPNSSHQISLRLMVNNNSLHVFKSSEDTIRVHAVDSTSSSNQSLKLDTSNRRKLLTDYKLNIKEFDKNCSILFDIINYNSEIEQQSVSVDCNGILNDISHNHGK